MKKLISVALFTVLLPSAVLAGPAPIGWEEDDSSTGTMTLKSLTWLPDIESSGENKLLKAKLDFHYEGGFISMGYDYNLNVNCRVQPQKRRGGSKTLYDETRDLTILDDMEFEGPKDFSTTLTFTLFPHEYQAAARRGMTCDVWGDGKGSLVSTQYDEGVRTYVRVKPKNGVWKVN